MNFEGADRFRLALSNIGLNQSAFAREIGVSRVFISEICRGIRRPSKKVLDNMTRHGVSSDWLLSGDGEMLSPEIGLPSLTQDDEPTLVGLAADSAKLQYAVTRRAELHQLLNEVLDGDHSGRLEVYLRSWMEGVLAERSIRNS